MSNAANHGWSATDQPSVYSTNASFVYSSAATAPVLKLLSPQKGERILDLGCGTGDLTHSVLAQAVGPEGHVVGTDVSESMIQGARRACPEQYKDRVEYHTIDGHDHATAKELEGQTFDAAFSNAALHWMKKDPAEVVRGIKTHLKPGGRFAAEFGGFLNMIGVRGALGAALRRRGIDPAQVDPWYFPTEKQYSTILESQGFRVETIERVPRPTPLSTGLAGWLATFASSFVSFLSEAEAQAVFREVEEECRADMWTDGEGWEVMYVRLRFRAVLQA